MIRRILLTLLALIATAYVVVRFVTPWPSVYLVRSMFGAGADKASAGLAPHVPRDVKTRIGVRYDANDPDALLDVYYPASPPAKDAPTIVWIHGGGFVSGRREDLANYLKILASRGFVVVNVGYTLAPEKHYPTPVRQMMTALGFIDREAASLGVNNRALVVGGDSAGAQIAAQVANLVTSPDYARAVGIAPTIGAAQLRGALLYCGVFNVEALGKAKGAVANWFVRTMTWSYSGARDWRDVPAFRLVSVTPHVTPAFPATFISVGNNDGLAPQSTALADALRARGVPVEALFYPPNHLPKLSHEYQFDLDGRDGRQALDRSVSWLKALTQNPETTNAGQQPAE